jgi:hypothetical protein
LAHLKNIGRLTGWNAGPINAAGQAKAGGKSKSLKEISIRLLLFVQEY